MDASRLVLLVRFVIHGCWSCGPLSWGWNIFGGQRGGQIGSTELNGEEEGRGGSGGRGGGRVGSRVVEKK